MIIVEICSLLIFGSELTEEIFGLPFLGHSAAAQTGIILGFGFIFARLYDLASKRIQNRHSN
jgi:hypothetical protein